MHKTVFMQKVIFVINEFQQDKFKKVLVDVSRVRNLALSVTFLTPEKLVKTEGQLQRVGEFTGFQMHKEVFMQKFI